MRWMTNRYNILLKKETHSPLYLILISWMVLLTFTSVGFTDELSLVTEVEFQPLASATQRLIEALDYLGSPLSEDDLSAIKEVLISDDHTQAIVDIQKILDAYCLTGVNINPESRVKVKEGPTNKELMQRGWRTFLVKVHNEAGVTAPLAAESANAAPLYKRSTGRPDPEMTVPKSDIPHRFLDIVVYSNPPLKASLSGLELEYRIVQLYSRDAGKREAMLGFNVGQGTQDIGFRSEVPILFDCVPAVNVTLEVYCHRKFRPLPNIRLCYNDNLFERSYPMAKRRKFTAQFKAEVVLEALRGESSQAELCRRYNLSETQISTWKQQGIEILMSGFATQNKQSSESAKRIAELERLVGRLTLDAEIQKKATTLLS